ncbi:flavin-dependent dehydrogenase [Synechococcus sp. Nb3U1]|uniref:FAD-dependent oxidoreductase n=1 Tax=Synechococcus sp. Nb3U1 TaxID=1914529 RepID=UPI001F3B6C03|nr:FAD-dependent monooxygenase [Synechococcus sp. Nb3U1]MCF2969799.1 flavin-dependent dehydrogenase [Synechococcus sp. Nb3U1]
MKELYYREIPCSDRAEVVRWLQTISLPQAGKQIPTSTGLRIQGSEAELALFTWSGLNTTYLKVFQWSERPFPRQSQWLKDLESAIQNQFPHRYPQLPAIDLSQGLPESQGSIFQQLEPYYPQTVKYFQRIPNGEFDLQRVYWWEKRWREEVQSPQKHSQPVLFKQPSPDPAESDWDLVIVGGALGAIYAAAMARLGYQVALVERLPFGRMNREWNISRRELKTLVEMGLLSTEQVESLILREYTDGFNKFFDGNSPIQAPVLHTPTVLNLAIDAEKLLSLCGEILKSCGGSIYDRSEFQRAYIDETGVTLILKDLREEREFQLRSRLLVDAMGTASPIAQQVHQQRAFDSVCPTVGATIQAGFEPGVWDPQFGDILASHGDISRGRQLIWELFPGPGNDLTFYLFHYHQVHPENPGSLLEMYEDFFTILPEYRRCDLEQLQWKKATFGYIPGRFGHRSAPKPDPDSSFDLATQGAEYHRVLLIGDAAAMQSPLSFTGFGSLVRNAPRLCDLLDTALRHDLLTAADLAQIRAYQGNSAVTWLFSRGMMVPTGKVLPPAQINATLNSFFGILATESPEVVDDFIKDRAGWIPFNRMAIKAALQNPRLLLWIWNAVGAKGFAEWLPTYFSYTGLALLSFLLRGWLPGLLRRLQPWLEARYPRLWLRCLHWSYTLTYGMGQPRIEFQLPTAGPLTQEKTQGPKPTWIQAEERV